MCLYLHDLSASKKNHDPSKKKKKKNTKRKKKKKKNSNSRGKHIETLSNSNIYKNFKIN